MKRVIVASLCVWSVMLLAGCATNREQEGAALRREIESSPPPRDFVFPPGLKKEILALDPEHVTGKDVREVLARAPAPRIIEIHGGIYPVYLAMISFSKFLAGMGYPAVDVRNPGDGSYSFSCYFSSLKIAGAIAWYYERDGLRPMIIGHSQGGMQAVKVLHELAGDSVKRIDVWNPLTEESEGRDEITDPLTGRERPVVGLRVSYTCALAAGGLTRILPNQWDVDGDLRKVPDSTVDFTGYYLGMDILGGDDLGYGPANWYKATGKATVRNVRLPTSYDHATIPDTEHLLASPEMIEWINDYTPTNEPALNVKFKGNSSNILWAADVWYEIKKHWVLELQRLIREKEAERDAG